MRKYREIVELLDNGLITQSQFLDALYNKVGPFSVQGHKVDANGNTTWITRMHEWLTVREQATKDTYNHRKICECEIVFDVDLPGWMNQKEREATLTMTLRRLKEKHGINPVVLDTGKGYHCHWFSHHIASLMLGPDGHNAKRKYAEEIISDVRTDMMKWNHRTSIAIECSPHWKRGNRIKLLTNF